MPTTQTPYTLPLQLLLVLKMRSDTHAVKVGTVCPGLSQHHDDDWDSPAHPAQGANYGSHDPTDIWLRYLNCNALVLIFLAMTFSTQEANFIGLFVETLLFGRLTASFCRHAH